MHEDNNAALDVKPPVPLTHSNLTRSVYQRDWIALIPPMALFIGSMFRHRWFTPHIYMRNAVSSILKQAHSEHWVAYLPSQILLLNTI